jgi:hypothetical protein
MIPWLSPKKTWEGLAGGVVFAATVGGVLAHFSASLPLEADRYPWWVGAIAGALAAVPASRALPAFARTWRAVSGLLLLTGLFVAALPGVADADVAGGLALALGGEVNRDDARQELGAFPIDLTEAGRSDPLFGLLPPTFDAQLGHHDHVDRLPPGVTLLATGRAVRNQAFKVDGKFKFWGGLACHIHGGGEHLVATLHAALEAAGIPVIYETTAFELLHDDARVQGVRARSTVR